MNWGNKIAFIYGGFVLFVIGMVVLCIKQDDIHLVSKEYYKEEIAYQNQIDKLNNTKLLRGNIGFQYEIEKQEVLFSLPGVMKEATGEIIFFRPADARKDWKLPVQLDENGNQQIPVSKLEKGLWKVKIQWIAQDVPYLNEQVLVIQ